MATIRNIRDSFSKRMKIRKALASIKRMNAILGKRGALFMTFALTSITRLQTNKDVTAEEFGKLVDAEMHDLENRYRDYRWAR